MGKKNKDGFFMSARKEFEHELVVLEIERCDNNKMEAARRLGISYATLKSVVKEGPKKIALTEDDRKFVAKLRASVLKRVAGERSEMGSALSDYISAVRAEMLETIRSGITAKL